MLLKDIISVSLILFSVIDIVGSIPVIVNLKKQGYKIESLKASTIAFSLMIAFLFVGESLLHLFGVDVQSFAVAGSLIIFFLGLEMILGVKLFQEDADAEESAAKSGTIVPLAFPLIAGAGTMTTILSLKAKYQELDILVAILLNIVIVYVVLRSSEWIGKKLGTNGTNVLRKVFGIILLAIAVKLFKDNFFVITDSVGH